MEILNYMEILVDDYIDDILTEMECCKCEHCKLDIKAITLNNMAPRYIVTEKGALYAKLNSLQVQFEVDIVKNIAHAAVIVKGNPRHS